MEITPLVMVLYDPLRTVFDPYRGIYIAGYISFVHNGVYVPWISSVNSFQFFTDISETMPPTNMYYISFERSFNKASSPFCCIKNHAEMVEKSQDKY